MAQPVIKDISTAMGWNLNSLQFVLNKSQNCYMHDASKKSENVVLVELLACYSCNL